MTVSAPPAAPDPSDPSTFNARATALVSWLATLVSDLNVYSGMTNSGQFTDGSAAGAGITFALDTNTGLFRPGADQIGMTTGGVQRALLSSAALQVDVPITGTAVVSSATDTTSGRLLTVGSHGIGLLGSAGNVTDIDVTTIAAGLRRYSSGSAGTFPSGVSASAGGVLLIIRETASKATMLLSPGGTNDTFIRSLNTTWGAWSKLIMVDASVSATAGQVLRQNDANTAVAFAANVTGSASVATTSGTSVDFTGIPPWARRITILFNGVSTSGTSPVIIQAGSGSFETTGYLGSSSSVSSGGAVAINTPANGFQIGAGSQAATFVRHGSIRLENLSGNIWQCTGSLGQSDAAQILSVAGGKTLSGVLDRVRLTTVGGTDTFDAGSVSITWE